MKPLCLREKNGFNWGCSLYSIQTLITSMSFDKWIEAASSCHQQAVFFIWILFKKQKSVIPFVPFCLLVVSRSQPPCWTLLLLPTCSSSFLCTKDSTWSRSSSRCAATEAPTTFYTGRCGLTVPACPLAPVYSSLSHRLWRGRPHQPSRPNRR